MFYIKEYGHNTIHVFNPFGNKLFSWEPPKEWLVVFSIAASKSEDLLYVGLFDGRVARVKPDMIGKTMELLDFVATPPSWATLEREGPYTSAQAAGSVEAATLLHLDGKDNLYLVDGALRHDVKVFDPQGRYVGSFTWSVLSDMGARVVAIADAKGAVYSPNGFEKKQMRQLMSKKAPITEYKGGRKISPEDFWGLDVDILIPASVTDVIHEKNKDNIKAKVIVEGANIPMPESVEDELHKRGILIVPDFVANAGGVISSYAEYRGYNPRDMFRTVERRIQDSTRKVLEESMKKGENPRAVALRLAAARIDAARRSS